MAKDKSGAWKVGLKATVGDGKTQIAGKAYFGVSTMRATATTSTRCPRRRP